LVVLIITLGQRPGLLLLIVTATAFGLHEFYRLTLPESRSDEQTVGIAVGLFFPLIAHFSGGGALIALLGAATLVLFLLFMARPRRLKTVVSHMPLLLFGIIYVAFLLSHTVLLRKQPMGTQWVFFLLMTVWAGDTCAYFVGTLIGKHRLYPQISPKKTVEGLLGGLAGSMVVAGLLRFLLLKSLPWSHIPILASLILILGQIGDLGESTLKRAVNAKDSSHLIPGHGGVLDRLDSFLFSAPFLYYYVLCFSQ
jgi:phosphatidate cytidylyltransferase